MNLDNESIKKLRQLILFTIVLLIALWNYAIIFEWIGVAFGIIFPFLLGGAIAFVLNVPMSFLEEKIFRNRYLKGKKVAERLARPVCLVLTIAIVIGVVVLVMFVVIPELTTTVISLGKTIRDFIPAAQRFLEDVFADNSEISKWLNGLNLNVDRIIESAVAFFQNGAGDVLNSTMSAIGSIVSGVAEGCRQSGAALIGGETAEHPGLMAEDEYDLAGFAVGVCDKKDMITGENLEAGDVLIGIASSGVHSNGFSLVRKVFDMSRESLETYHECLGRTLGEALLEPTRIYVKALESIRKSGVTIKACSHITGGGFYENVPRMLRKGTHAVIRKDSYEVPAIFKMLAEEGDIEEQMMYNTFNMGIGMVIAVKESDVEAAMSAIVAAGDTSHVIGQIEAGEKGVTLC